MIHLASLPIISKAGAQSRHQSRVPIGGFHQQGPAVGTPLALIELGQDRLAKNSWEQQTLCCAIVRHSEASFVAQTLSSQHVCNRGGLCCLQIYELSELVCRQRDQPESRPCTGQMKP